MKGERIAYYEGVKYQLAAPYTTQTRICPPFDIETEWIDLSRDGLLTIRPGFAWDGPSGPAPDLKRLMRGSLKHDGFADLMRQGFLDFKTYFCAVNEDLEETCVEDGCPELAAHLVFHAVHDMSGCRWARFCSDGEGGSRPLCFAP